MKIFVANEWGPVGEDVKSELTKYGHTYNEENDLTDSELSETDFIRTFDPDAIILEASAGASMSFDPIKKWFEAGLFKKGTHRIPIMMLTGPHEWEKWSDAFVHWNIDQVLPRPFEEGALGSLLLGIAASKDQKITIQDDWGWVRPSESISGKIQLTDAEVILYSGIIVSDEPVPLAEFMAYLKDIRTFVLVGNDQDRESAKAIETALQPYFLRDQPPSGIVEEIDRTPINKPPLCRLDKAEKRLVVDNFRFESPPGNLSRGERDIMENLVLNMGSLMSYYFLYNSGGMEFSSQHKMSMNDRLHRLQSIFPGCIDIFPHLGAIARMDGNYVNAFNGTNGSDLKHYSPRHN